MATLRPRIDWPYLISNPIEELDRARILSTGSISRLNNIFFVFISISFRKCLIKRVAARFGPLFVTHTTGTKIGVVPKLATERPGLVAGDQIRQHR